MTRKGIPKIAVLMSSYNGEKYICEQIESILNQAGVEVTLFVRDDCSSDSTPDILELYEREGKIVFVRGEENLRPASSFMTLFYDVCESGGYDYYSFSDQDDIWLPDKLLHAIGMMRGMHGPVLYCSNQTVFSEGKDGQLRYGSTPHLSLLAVLFENQVSGCTMVFNDELARELGKEEHRPNRDVLDLRMHDTWALLVASIIGSVMYDPESRILYRVHADNQVGVKNDKRGMLARCRVMARFILKRDATKYRSKYAVELLQRFPEMPPEFRSPLFLIASYSNSVCGKIRMMLNREIRMESQESPVSYSAKVFLGII